jgi:hypothetical protein
MVAGGVTAFTDSTRGRLRDVSPVGTIIRFGNSMAWVTTFFRIEPRLLRAGSYSFAKRVLPALR